MFFSFFVRRLRPTPFLSRPEWNENAGIKDQPKYPSSYRSPPSRRILLWPVLFQLFSPINFCYVPPTERHAFLIAVILADGLLDGRAGSVRRRPLFFPLF